MENASRQINAKFDLASQLAARLLAVDGGAGARDALGALEIELEALRTRYALCTSHLYIQTALGEAGRLSAREEFLRVVASENFEGDLDHLVRRLRIAAGVSGEDGAAPRGRGRATKKAGAPAPAAGAKKAAPPREVVREVRTLIDQYEGVDIDCSARAVERSCETHGGQYNVCPECQVQMFVSTETSELTCTSCGKVRELIGTVFDDAQFYNQEGQKAKSGSFNPNRHYHFWMEHILAREPEEELGNKDDPENVCGEKLVARLRDMVRRDRRVLRLLTVDDVRDMLKEEGRTDLNKNAPLILRRLTGVGPPQLPESICQRAEKIFSKAIEIGERVRPEGRTNRNYYPYYIYKILDAILPDEGPEARDQRRVLYYIYMQGQDTLDKNDQEWEEICEELPEIEWAPTSRAAAQKYRPL